MFNLGFGEILVIAVILIIVVGPDRIPELLRTIGKTLRGVQKASRDLQTSIGLDELRRELLYPPIKSDESRKSPSPSERTPQIAPVQQTEPFKTEAAEAQTGQNAGVLPAVPEKGADRQGGGASS